MVKEILYNIKMTEEQEKELEQILTYFNAHQGEQAILIPNYALKSQNDGSYQMADEDYGVFTITIAADLNCPAYLHNKMLDFTSPLFMVDVIMRDSVQTAIEELTAGLVDTGVQCYYFGS